MRRVVERAKGARGLPVRLEIGDNLVHTTHITEGAVTLTHTANVC